MSRPPDLPSGVYRHYKGHLYLVLGYGRDASRSNRDVVIYVGLELDGAKAGPRMYVRDVAEFFDIVNPTTGVGQIGFPHPSAEFPRRFTYVGPGWAP